MSYDVVDYRELIRVRTQIRKLIDIIEIENPELFNSELVKGIIEELML
jgi:hypothetical protein